MESAPIQSRKRFAILSRLHPAEVIITTQNPSASSNLGPVLMNRYDVITRLTNFRVIIKMYRSKGLAKN